VTEMFNRPTFRLEAPVEQSGTREGIMDLETGKTELFELLEFPLVRRRLRRIAPLNRANFPRPALSSSARAPHGPGRPAAFRDRWREIARARPAMCTTVRVGQAPP
jgi:hypothetical protein